jgi:hypothetical protein
MSKEERIRKQEDKEFRKYTEKERNGDEIRR